MRMLLLDAYLNMTIDHSTAEEKDLSYYTSMNLPNRFFGMGERMKIFPSIFRYNKRKRRKVMKSCFMIFIVGLSLNALAFPKASEAEVTEFRRLFRECLEDNCNKESFMLGRRDFGSYKKFSRFGLEICELIYLESVNGDVVRAIQADNKYSPYVIGIESQSILIDLWCMYTMQFSTRYTDVDFMWTEEPIRLQWEGGAQLANERASFLVKEMRIAKHENRLVDARRAMGNLQIMGVFAFPTLFNELMQGNDDVVEILANEEWPVGNAPILNKEGLLKWWKKNCTRYELPQQFANFRGSSQLEKWKRIEGQDCKITVFDAQNGMSSLAVDSDGASRLTPGVSLAFSGSGQQEVSLSVNGISIKTNVVEFQTYLDTIGFHAIRKSLAPGGTLVWKMGVQDAVWVMWQRDIVIPFNDVCCTEWRCPTNASINSLRLDVRQLDASRFDVLNASSVIANAEVSVFNTYADKLQFFINSFARRCIGNAPLAMNLLDSLDVSYLGAETNMLYITERGSLEDSLTYKNITLKIRYKDNSLSKHRKAIAEALMTAGAVTKPKASKVSVTIRRDENN